MKQTSIHIPISDRDYPRAPREFSSRSSDQEEVIPQLANDQDDMSLIEPLAGEEKTRELERIRSTVRSEFNSRKAKDLIAEFGVQSNWSKYSDFEIHVRATELIEKFNREGIDFPSFWNSLV